MTSTPPECGAAVRDRRTAEMSAASVDDGALRERVRSLLQRTGTHPVISLYLDLDPEQFPTPKARDSQITSLLDRSRELAAALALDHAARKTLTADLQGGESGRPPARGSARGPTRSWRRSAWMRRRRAPRSWPPPSTSSRWSRPRRWDAGAPRWSPAIVS